MDPLFFLQFFCMCKKLVLARVVSHVASCGFHNISMTTTKNMICMSDDTSMDTRTAFQLDGVWLAMIIKRPKQCTITFALLRYFFCNQTFFLMYASGRFFSKVSTRIKLCSHMCFLLWVCVVPKKMNYWYICLSMVRVQWFPCPC